MNLTGLDITLQRINTIENRFQSLMSYGVQPDEDFQKILDSSISHSKDPSDASRSEIENLIEKYADKNGAMGLMQLMPSTAQGLGVTNAYDAEQNIMGGTKYLKGLMDRFDNNKSLALAAYNAGPNAVKKYGGIPPYMETQNYVKNVLGSYERMKGDK